MRTHRHTHINKKVGKGEREMFLSVKLLDWGEDSMGRSDGESVRAAFRQEVAVWHKLDHPNVTKVDSNELYFLPNP
jgi:hypothetical protein